MGQYHIPVNLDKREFIDPHTLGNGLKLWEQGASQFGVTAALHALLAVSNGRGGGDYVDGHEEFIGRWGGDRIAIVGDYAEEGDLPAEFAAHKIYPAVCSTRYDGYPADEIAPYQPGEWKDISDLACAWIEAEFDGKFSGDGWRDFVPNPGSFFDESKK